MAFILHLQTIMLFTIRPKSQLPRGTAENILRKWLEVMSAGIWRWFLLKQAIIIRLQFLVIQTL
jgi:hypothetical protein